MTASCLWSVSVAYAFPTNKSYHLVLLGLSRTFYCVSVGRERKKRRERIKGKGRLERRRSGVGWEKKTRRKSCSVLLGLGKLWMWNWMKHGRLVCPPLPFQVNGFFGCLVVTNFFTVILGERRGVLGGATIFTGDINRSFGPALVCRSRSGASWELGSIDVLSKNSTDYRTDFPISRAIFNSLPTTAASL